LIGAGSGNDPFLAAAGPERLPEADYRFAEPMRAREAGLAALGWQLGAYKFDRYKSQKAAKARLVAPEGVDVERILRIAAAVFGVRDLVNIPAGDMSPGAIEERARDLARRFDASATSIVGDELVEQNLPLIHAVGRAAAAAPRLIDLAWGPVDAPKVTLIGKGVAFDSGGLDIKNAENMRLMKKDMGGAAHALGLAELIMQEGLKLRLRVLIPAVENAISGNAFRPGDIIRSRKGLTVEIGNTDAEGRLILADAMALAEEEKPALAITLATLTGAARIALGPDLPAFFCDDERFAADIAAAAREAEDPVWRLPLWQGYEQMLQTPIADINNAANGTFAGAITAALFLKRFAPAGATWAHFDLYAWRAKAAPGRPIGGEAQAIRALFDVLRTRFG
jgi:leucyl aminopeptidase